MKALGIEVKLHLNQTQELVNHVKENYPEVYHQIYNEGWGRCTTDYHNLTSECCGSCTYGCEKSPCGTGWIPRRPDEDDVDYDAEDY